MRSIVILLATLSLAAPPSRADTPAETSGSLVSFARSITYAPSLTAAARRSLAARERIGAAGRLPDPQVEGMASRMIGPMDERSEMLEFNLRQPLPKKGERSAERERARAATAMAEADYAAMAGEMAADIAMALAEAEGAQERIRLLATQVERLRPVLHSVEVRLAAGRSKAADRYTVETRIASMQLMIEEEKRMAADALASARGRLGLGPDAPLPSFAVPLATDIRPEESAAVHLAAARTHEAEAMVRMARASANPMTAVGVRFERERTAMGNEDTLGLALMSDIPWRSRSYARTERRAAEIERAAAQDDANAARHRISAALSRVTRAEQLAATARRLSGETLARLNAEYETLIRATSVGENMSPTMGESTVLQIAELLEKSVETELQIVRAETALRTARAALWAFVPVTTFSLRTH